MWGFYRYLNSIQFHNSTCLRDIAVQKILHSDWSGDFSTINEKPHFFQIYGFCRKLKDNQYFDIQIKKYFVDFSDPTDPMRLYTKIGLCHFSYFITNLMQKIKKEQRANSEILGCKRTDRAKSIGHFRYLGCPQNDFHKTKFLYR